MNRKLSNINNHCKNENFNDSRNEHPRTVEKYGRFKTNPAEDYISPTSVNKNMNYKNYKPTLKKIDDSIISRNLDAKPFTYKEVNLIDYNNNSNVNSIIKNNSMYQDQESFAHHTVSNFSVAQDKNNQNYLKYSNAEKQAPFNMNNNSIVYPENNDFNNTGESFYNKDYFNIKNSLENKSGNWRNNLVMSPMIPFDKFSDVKENRILEENIFIDTNNSIKQFQDNDVPKTKSKRKYKLSKTGLNTSSSILVHDIEKLIAVEKRKLNKEQLEEAVLPNSKSKSKTRHHTLNNSFDDYDKGTFKFEYQNLKNYITNTSPSPDRYTTEPNNPLSQNNSPHKTKSNNKKCYTTKENNFNLFLDMGKFKQNQKKYKLNHLLKDDETSRSKNHQIEELSRSPTNNCRGGKIHSTHHQIKKEVVNLYNFNEAYNFTKSKQIASRKRHATEAY